MYHYQYNEKEIVKISMLHIEKYEKYMTIGANINLHFVDYLTKMSCVEYVFNKYYV